MAKEDNRSRSEVVREVQFRLGVIVPVTGMAMLVVMFIVAAGSPVWVSALGVLAVAALAAKAWAYARYLSGMDQ
ncbi:MAG UNVERIFIED_CONTAM: hypothetical protein LOD86_11005 [Thermobifida fusca]